MKSIAILALLGEISAIQLQQLHQARFIPNEILEADGLSENAAVQAHTDVNLDSDPITGSLGQAAKLLPEVDVDAVVQNDLRTRSPVDFHPKLDGGVTDTHDSLAWAEKSLRKKLTDPADLDPAKMPIAIGYDPEAAPQYVLPKDMLEDEDTADTLKSAHLAEWIEKNGGDPARHHHHDPYHIDGDGNETEYRRPGGGYQGVGFDHAGRADANGQYGLSNKGYQTSEEFASQKPTGPIAGLYDGQESMPAKVNPWWHNLEKNQFDGMAARKSYDKVAQDIIEKNEGVDVKKVSAAILRREYEFQAAAHAARQTDDVKADAREIGSLFQVVEAEDAEREAQRAAAAEEAAQREAKAAESQKKLDEESKKAEALRESEAARTDEAQAKALSDKHAKEEEKKRDDVEADVKKEQEEVNQARKEKADKVEEEKKEEEVTKKVAEEKKAVEDPKVENSLQQEDKTQEAKLVPRMEKQAADIEKAKASGDAVDNAPADVQAVIGTDRAKQLEQPSDAPSAPPGSAAPADSDWIPPELAGSFAQTSEQNAVVNGMVLGNIKTPELDQQLGLDQENIPQPSFLDNDALLQLTNQEKLARLQRARI